MASLKIAGFGGFPIQPRLSYGIPNNEEEIIGTQPLATKA
jgi:hypothetical protein